MPDTPASRGGCGRHLLILGALVALAVGAFVARDPGGVARVLDNQRALGEGADAAAALDSPDALLAWIAAHPERASLVVLGADGRVLLDVGGDVERPAAGLGALWAAAEWAVQTAGGRADTSAVAPGALAARRLPGMVGQADSVALGPRALVRRAVAGDRAAESVLVGRLGAEAVAARARRYGAEPPVPFEGLLLAWQRGDTTGAEAPALARRLAQDGAFRAEAVRQLREDGLRLTLPEQRRAAAVSLPRASAAGAARLLADALADSLGGPEASALLLDVLAAPDAVLGPGVRFGSKGGGLPGHLAFAAWAQTPDGPDGRAAVLVLDGLPLAVFYHLVQTGLDGALVVRLLADDAFLDTASGRF